MLFMSMDSKMSSKIRFIRKPHFAQTLQMKGLSLVGINKCFLKLDLSENSLLYTSQVRVPRCNASHCMSSKMSSKIRFIRKWWQYYYLSIIYSP